MQRLFLLPILGLAAAPLATAQIFYGTDDVSASENFRLDVATGVSTGPVFTGSEAWGLADDDAAQLFYINDGATLLSAPYSGGAATNLGGLTYNGAVRTLVSLAHHNGVLYGNPNLAIEGFYTVDVVTLDTTLVYTFSATAMDLGGLDFDPATGLVYGSNDASGYTDPQGTAGRGIVVFDLFAPTITETTTYPYPTSATGTELNDVDGLAFDPAGVIYMLEDNPAPLHRFIIAANMYDAAPPQNAVLASEVFSAGTHTKGAAGTIGTNYCPAVANTSGAAGSILATGSDVAANNNLTLVASNMPQNQFGFFLASMTQDSVPNAGGSNGTLCLGGTIGRYVGAGQIQNAGVGGTFSLALDLTQTPAGPIFVGIAAGETWNFQAWFRDTGPMGQPESNFTNGLSVLFM